MFWTDAQMAAIESGAGDAGAWVQTAEEVYAEHQAENLAAAELAQVDEVMSALRDST